jgi:hypothetical protein
MSVTSVTERYHSRGVTQSIRRYRRYHTLKGGNAVTVTLPRPSLNLESDTATIFGLTTAASQHVHQRGRHVDD